MQLDVSPISSLLTMTLKYQSSDAFQSMTVSKMIRMVIVLVTKIYARTSEAQKLPIRRGLKDGWTQLKSMTIIALGAWNECIP